MTKNSVHTLLQMAYISSLTVANQSYCPIQWCDYTQHFEIEIGLGGSLSMVVHTHPES